MNEKAGCVVTTSSFSYIPARRKELGQVGYVDCQVLEEEVPRAVAGHIRHAQAEAGIAEVAYSPGAAPGVRCTAKCIDRFGRAQVWRLLGGCPGGAPIPGKLDADLRVVLVAVCARIEADLDALDHRCGRQADVEVVEAVFILACVCAGLVVVRTAVRIGGEGSIVCKGIGRVGLVAVVIACSGGLRSLGGG